MKFMFALMMLVGSVASAQSLQVIHEDLCEQAAISFPLAMPSAEQCLLTTKIDRIDHWDHTEYIIGFPSCESDEFAIVSYVPGSAKVTVRGEALDHSLCE